MSWIFSEGLSWITPGPVVRRTTFLFVLQIGSYAACSPCRGPFSLKIFNHRLEERRKDLTSHHWRFDCLLWCLWCIFAWNSGPSLTTSHHFELEISLRFPGNRSSATRACQGVSGGLTSTASSSMRFVLFLQSVDLAIRRSVCSHERGRLSPSEDIGSPSHVYVYIITRFPEVFVFRVSSRRAAVDYHLAKFVPASFTLFSACVSPSFMLSCFSAAHGRWGGGRGLACLRALLHSTENTPGRSSHILLHQLSSSL